MTTPRASSPYLKQTNTLEDLEPNTDNDIIDITNFLERPANDKWSPQTKQNFTTHTATQGHCPTPQNSPMYLPMKQWQQHLPNITEQIRGILPDK